MQRILIVGGNGFIGAHLVSSLAAAYPNAITVLDLYPRPYDALPAGINFIQANLSDPLVVRRLLIDQGITTVYHLAWGSIHETATRNPVADVDQNLTPTLSLLEACRETKVKRVIFMSSGGTVYGIPNSYPVTEEHPTNPINAYGVTKLAVEKYLQMYHHLYGLEYVILRPSVSYGPRQNPHRRQGAVTVFVYQALLGKPITVFGDGTSLRDYCFVEDITTALVSALSHPFSPNAIFNLGGGEAHTLTELIQIIEQTLNLRIKVNYEPARRFDAPRLHLDINRASERLGWRPTIKLPEGIERTAKWLRGQLV